MTTAPTVSELANDAQRGQSLRVQRLVLPKYVNPNPRVGVLLSQNGASVRLYNVLNPKFGMKGIVWLRKNWPEERLRRELPGYGQETSREWNAILAARIRR